MISLNVGCSMPSGVVSNIEVVAISHMFNAEFQGEYFLHLHCELNDLPREGLFIVAVGSWNQAPPQPPRGHRSFALKVFREENYATCEFVEPNIYWQFVGGGSGELESAADPGFTVYPSEIGYFRCFTDPEFERKEFLCLALEQGGIDANDLCLVDALFAGDVRSGVRLVKILATSRLFDKGMIDQLGLEVTKRIDCLLETYAWLESLNHPDIGPLFPLVSSASSEVRGHARNAAGYVTRAMMATGVEKRQTPYSGKFIRVFEKDLPLTCHLMQYYRPDLVLAKHQSESDSST